MLPEDLRKTEIMRTPFPFFTVAVFCMLFASCSKDYSCWMKALPDDMPVWQVSMPGSHDAATGTIPVDDPARMYAGTQSYDIETQFMMGVRAFDLRPGFKDNDTGSLRIMHSYVDAGVSADEAVGIIARMLKEQPSEFAVIVTRIENTDFPDDVLEAAKDGLSSLEKKYCDLGVAMSSFRPGLTVGDLRGKILFINRNDFGAGRFMCGARAYGWGEGSSIAGSDGKKVTINVQDEYEWEDDDKFADGKVACFMEHAAKFAGESGEVWSVNHVSGYFFRDGLPRPHEFAAGVAPVLVGSLDSWSRKGPMGIVLLDYSGDPEYKGDVLISKIIERNF